MLQAQWSTVRGFRLRASGSSSRTVVAPAPQRTEVVVRSVAFTGEPRPLQNSRRGVGRAQGVCDHCLDQRIGERVLEHLPHRIGDQAPLAEAWRDRVAQLDRPVNGWSLEPAPADEHSRFMDDEQPGVPSAPLPGWRHGGHELVAAPLGSPPILGDRTAAERYGQGA